MSQPLSTEAGAAAGRLLSGSRPPAARALVRSTAVGGGALLVVLAAMAFLPGANLSYLLAVLPAVALAVVVARAESPEDRLLSMGLFVWALLLRLVATAAGHLLGAGNWLGPDSQTYLVKSGQLAASGLRLDVLPVVHFGTYDAGHFYLYAAAIRYLGADLFGLQTLNGALVALVPPLAFGFTRLMRPRAGVAVGVLLAVHPSLIALSAVDLLKDPSVVFATCVLVWSVARVLHDHRPGAVLVYAVGGTAAAVYLRTARFYTFAYLELSFLAALVLLALSSRSGLPRRVPVALVLAMFMTAEAVPMRWAWPPSPVMLADQVAFALGSPGLRFYAAGLLDRALHPRLAEHDDAEFRTMAGGVLRYPVDFVRRLYGPFVWVPPDDWRFSTLRRGEYLLYPGMLVWYALIPFVAIGMVIAARAIVRRAAPALGVLWVWCFTTIYFVQYFSSNLSYRQRDVMLPMVLLFAHIGVTWAAGSPHWRLWYARYWMALAALAAAHVTARAILVR